MVYKRINTATIDKLEGAFGKALIDKAGTSETYGKLRTDLNTVYSEALETHFPKNTSLHQLTRIRSFVDDLATIAITKYANCPNVAIKMFGAGVDYLVDYKNESATVTIRKAHRYFNAINNVNLAATMQKLESADPERIVESIFYGLHNATDMSDNTNMGIQKFITAMKIYLGETLLSLSSTITNNENIATSSDVLLMRTMQEAILNEKPEMMLIISNFIERVKDMPLILEALSLEISQNGDFIHSMSIILGRSSLTDAFRY